MTTARASDTAAEAASDAHAAVLRWVRLAPDPPVVRLVCAQGPDRLPTHRDVLAVRVPGCVHELPVSGYLELALAGATAVTLVPGRCCAPDDEPAALVDARTLLTSHGRSVALAVDASPRRGPHRAHPVPPAAGLPLPRRALLAPMLLTRLPYRPHTERERLLAALEELGEPAPHLAAVVVGPDGTADLPAGQGTERPPDEPAAPTGDAPAADAGEPHLASAPPAGALLAATGCTTCAVCVKGCPTGALAIGGEPPLLTLTQDASRCTDCGECIRLCPERAVTRVRPLTWQDLRERTVRPLATVETVACTRCGQPVPTARAENGLCPVCAYRRRNPFGSALPPSLTQR